MFIISSGVGWLHQMTRVVSGGMVGVACIDKVSGSDGFVSMCIRISMAHNKNATQVAFFAVERL